MLLKAELVIAAAAVAVLALYVLKKGGINAAATSAGAAVVEAAGSAASGAVGAIGSGVGLPTPTQTTTDPQVARWLIDHHGYWTASLWSGAWALAQALTLPAGSGTPPAQGSAIAVGVGYDRTNYDESDRLLRRYPPSDDGRTYGQESLIDFNYF